MPQSVYQFLKGKWRVKRNVFNAKRETQGILIGEAEFTPKDKRTLEFSEKLEGLFDDHCGKAWHTQELSFKRRDMATVYRQGALFHDLNFNLPFSLVHHHCKEDLYLGLYVFNRAQNTFTVIWKIKGPKKNYSLRAYYEKVS